MKLFDQHVHTNYSPDSTTTIQEYLSLADDLKLDHVVFTDHCDYDALFDSKDHIVNQSQLRNEVESLKDDFNAQVLYGVEMGYRKTYIKEINDYIRQHAFDVVLLSVHDIEGLDYYVPQNYKISSREFVESYFKLYLEAMDNVEDYDIVTHLTYALTALFNVENKLYDLSDSIELIDQVLLKIIKNQKVLEINTRSMFPTESTYYFDFIVERYLALGGVEFALSSDAHRVKMYMYKFDLAIKLLKEKGVKKLVVFKNRKKHFVDLV